MMAFLYRVRTGQESECEDVIYASLYHMQPHETGLAGVLLVI